MANICSSEVTFGSTLLTLSYDFTWTNVRSSALASHQSVHDGEQALPLNGLKSSHSISISWCNSTVISISLVNRTVVCHSPSSPHSNNTICKSKQQTSSLPSCSSSSHPPLVAHAIFVNVNTCKPKGNLIIVRHAFRYGCRNTRVVMWTWWACQLFRPHLASLPSH